MLSARLTAVVGRVEHLDLDFLCPIRFQRVGEIETKCVIPAPVNAERFYYALIFTPYLFSLTFGSIWPPVFCALSVPLAVSLKATAARGDFSALVPGTAKLVAVYGLLLTLGLYMAA